MGTRKKGDLTSSGLATKPVTSTQRRSARLQKASSIKTPTTTETKAREAAPMSIHGPRRGRLVFSHVEIEVRRPFRQPIYQPRPHKLPRISARPADSSGAPLYVIAKRHILYNGHVRYEIEVQNEDREHLIVTLERILDYVSSRHLQDFENDVALQELREERKVADRKAAAKASRIRAKKRIQSVKASISRASTVPPTPLLGTSTSNSISEGHAGRAGAVRKGRLRGTRLSGLTAAAINPPLEISDDSDESTSRSQTRSIRSSSREVGNNIGSTSGLPSNRLNTQRPPRSKFTVEVPPLRKDAPKRSSRSSTPSLSDAAATLQKFQQPKRPLVSSPIPSPNEAASTLQRFQQSKPRPSSSQPAQPKPSRVKKTPSTQTIKLDPPPTKKRKIGGPAAGSSSSSQQQSILGFTVPHKSQRQTATAYANVKEVEDSELSSSSSDVLESSSTAKKRESPYITTSPAKRIKKSPEASPLYASSLGKKSKPLDAIECYIPEQQKEEDEEKEEKFAPIEAVLDDKFEAQKVGSKLVISRFFLVRRVGSTSGKKSYQWIDEDELGVEMGQDTELLDWYKASWRFKIARE